MQRLWQFLSLAFGRVGFEAYSDRQNGRTFDGRAIPAWIALPSAIREAWGAAALAVLWRFMLAWFAVALLTVAGLSLYGCGPNAPDPASALDAARAFCDALPRDGGRDGGLRWNDPDAAAEAPDAAGELRLLP